MARDIIKGEKEDSRIVVTESDDGLVDVANPVFDVVDGSDNIVQADAIASLSNNGTAAVEIYGLIDTTNVLFVDGNEYKVRFTFTIGTQLRKGYELITITETLL